MNFVIVYTKRCIEKWRLHFFFFLKNVFVLISTETDNLLWLVVTRKTMQHVGKRPRNVKVLGFVFEFSLNVNLMHSGENGTI